MNVRTVDHGDFAHIEVQMQNGVEFVRDCEGVVSVAIATVEEGEVVEVHLCVLVKQVVETAWLICGGVFVCWFCGG